MNRCELHFIDIICVGYNIKNMKIFLKKIIRHKFKMICVKIPALSVVKILFLFLPLKSSIATTDLKILTSDRGFFYVFFCSDFFPREVKNIRCLWNLKWCFCNDIFYLFTEVINYHVKSLTVLYGSNLWLWLLFFRSMIVIWYSKILVTCIRKNGIFAKSFACWYYYKFFQNVVHRCQWPNKNRFYFLLYFVKKKF